MPRLFLMSDLVLRCQRRADMEFATVLQPPEWKALISEMYGQMYSTVVKAGYRYFESTATITANGAASYALPADHDATIGIDRIIDAASGQTEQLGELMIQERNMWSGQTGNALAYSLVGQTIVLFPRPTAGTYTHIYVPQSPELSSLADSSTVDLVTADGEAFLINGVAVKALPKTESDTTSVMNERDEALKRFAEDVQMRALVNPRRRIPMGARGGYGRYWDDDDPFAGDPGSWRNR
jgi:hypothetical protein